MPESRIGIVNGLQDTIEMLTWALGSAGFDTVSWLARDVREGRIDLVEIARAEQLAAIIYDIAIPYAENWRVLDVLRTRHAGALPPMVITTTNVRALQEVAGVDTTGVIEIIGKPYDLEQLVNAVRRAVGAE